MRVRVRACVQVTDDSLPLTVTIAWNDPPNVMWATKNLLHDLDLIVTFLPADTEEERAGEGATDVATGAAESVNNTVYYGNNIPGGDEFNPCERVQIKSPLVGVYQVVVLAHMLPASVTGRQHYSIVISSHGQVLEGRTTVDPISTKEEEVGGGEAERDKSALHCADAIDGTPQVLMRFQLEDWQAGLSWHKQPLFTMVKNIFHVFGSESESGVSSAGAGNGAGAVVMEQPPDSEDIFYNCTFTPNSETQLSTSNRVHQCSVCLESDASYTIYLDTDRAFNDSSHLIRVSSQCNNIFLSQFWKHEILEVNSWGECNPCLGESQSTIEVLMLSNVTDDDFEEYSWHGLAHYTIRHSDGMCLGGSLCILHVWRNSICHLSPSLSLALTLTL